MTDMPRAHCRTCMFWRQGLAPVATTVRLPDASPDLGICEYHPPTVHVVGGAAMSLFPAVHADHCCFEWTPDVHDGPRGANVIPVDFGSAA